METVATEAWVYESEPFPGLLQAEEYVKAVVSTRSDAERFSTLRVTRQKRLTDDNPLILRVVLTRNHPALTVRGHLRAPDGTRAR